jgi:hypothetical protein
MIVEFLMSEQQHLDLKASFLDFERHFSFQFRPKEIRITRSNTARLETIQDIVMGCT